MKTFFTAKSFLMQFFGNSQLICVARKVNKIFGQTCAGGGREKGDIGLYISPLASIVGKKNDVSEIR